MNRIKMNFVNKNENILRKSVGNLTLIQIVVMLFLHPPHQ